MTGQTYGQQQNYPTYEVPQGEFELHPPVSTIGMVTEFEDLGMVESTFGVKHRFKFKIECMSKKVDRREVDGKPHFVTWQVTNAGGDRANLTMLREAAMGRPLKSEEQGNFNPADVVGKYLQYTVAHRASQDGQRTYANIKSVSALAPELIDHVPPFEGEVAVGQDNTGRPYRVYLVAKNTGDPAAAHAADPEPVPEPAPEPHPDSTGDDDLPF